MGRAAESRGVMIARTLRGPLTGFGLMVAAAVCLIEQGTKLWLLFGYHLPEKGAVPILPFIDLVLVWNRGISYGLFQQESELGQWILFGLKIVAVLLLCVWLA